MTKIGFQDRLLLNGGKKYCRMLQGEHSAILLTFIKLPFVINIFVLSTWPLETGFTVISVDFIMMLVPNTSDFYFIHSISIQFHLVLYDLICNCIMMLCDQACGMARFNSIYFMMSILDKPADEILVIII